MTLSLDTLKTGRFREITGSDSLEQVFEAIESAKLHGFDPVKINAVIVRGVNDDELVDFAHFARANELEMRFIEYMPLDSGHDWNRDQVVSGREIFEKINAAYPLKLKSNERGSETAWKYEFADEAQGGIGIIAPVTEMFCGQCSRIRLTADGQIRTCLFSTVEHDLRDYLRSGASRLELVDFIQAVTLKKEPAHRINEPDFLPASRTMSFIGG
jgi:cyclic pyranopterin phosphate synthase